MKLRGIALVLSAMLAVSFHYALAAGQGASDTLVQPRQSASDGQDGYIHTTRPLSQMTLAEIDRIQTEQGGWVAVGKFQFGQKALRGFARDLGLNPTDIFSAEVQDRFAQQVLVRSGLNDYVDKKITAQQFQHGLAVNWGSIADPATGKSLYGNPVGTTTEQIQGSISQIRQRN